MFVCWLRAGVALPQGMLKPGCCSWCVPGHRAVVQGLLAESWVGVALPDVQVGQGPSGSFFRVCAWGRQTEAASGLNYVNLGLF